MYKKAEGPVAVPEMRRRRRGDRLLGARLISISVCEEGAVRPTFDLSRVTESLQSL